MSVLKKPPSLPCYVQEPRWWARCWASSRPPCSILFQKPPWSHIPSSSFYGLLSCPLLCAGWSSIWQLTHGCLTQQVKKSKQVSSDQVGSQRPPFVLGTAPLRHLSILLGRGPSNPNLRQDPWNGGWSGLSHGAEETSFSFMRESFSLISFSSGSLI